MPRWPTRSFEERFDEYVMPEPNSGCGLWTGALTGAGYAYFGCVGDRYAHRISYRRYKGEIPANRELDHKCRVRSCVYPDHLEVVTRRTNALRGVGFSAKNDKKTHCPRGHPYAGDNLLVRTYPDGRFSGRQCRTCQNESRRKH